MPVKSWSWCLTAIAWRSTTPSGRRIGEIEAKTAERVMQLMAGGNIYEVYALGPSAASIRVILREVHHDPSLAGQISFPRQIAATRKYLRERDDLRRRDESDFYLEDDDADEDELAAPHRIRKTTRSNPRTGYARVMSIRTRTTSRRSNLTLHSVACETARGNCLAPLSFLYRGSDQSRTKSRTNMSTNNAPAVMISRRRSERI